MKKRRSPITPPSPLPARAAFRALFALLVVATPLAFLPTRFGQVVNVLDIPRLDSPRRLLVALLAVQLDPTYAEARAKADEFEALLFPDL